jgi:hypothetical protein
MAVLLVTEDKEGNVLKVEYVTDVSLIAKGSKIVKQLTQDPITKPQTGLGGGYDSTTFQLYQILTIKDAIIKSPKLTAVEKLNALQEWEKFQHGDVIRFGWYDPRTRQLRSSDTYQPPIKKIIKFNDP